MKILFGHYELCKCLDKLGFVPEKQHGTSHVKFSTPKGHTVPKGSRPFIIVIYNKKQYHPHTCSSYLRQIVQLGFDRDIVITYLQDQY
ncbi:hypothetical protein COY16_00015 [Candidatus Roizmanbacteria bacterium CG_4_10_14_0_2_um_filter_39_13]|uniref:Type II toxin-antitoxin system HicA family toxin n=1 Tax=Candidatus Roizmanbacteria bacterium CG_4_10_14_0_2_um_filter_39_13 TaxID=1974825 RepID=A0A2M7U206_9BACT|nr:MAG: hypothetical protein COY16_00015 [Candidatus Roizmanbacteria bacterium CG_4_10_14_0_2_um_filter_39_13]